MSRDSDNFCYLDAVNRRIPRFHAHAYGVRPRTVTLGAYSASIFTTGRSPRLCPSRLGVGQRGGRRPVQIAVWASPLLCELAGGRVYSRTKWNSLQGGQVHYTDAAARHHMTAGSLSSIVLHYFASCLIYVHKTIIIRAS